MKDRLKGARLAAAAVLALLLFNYPFLAVFDTDSLVLGVPLLWAYLFIVWAAVIALAAWIARS
ncbi:MAG: hypothetical protein ACXWDL_15385 [Nocardioides sp.]